MTPQNHSGNGFGFGETSRVQRARFGFARPAGQLTAGQLTIAKQATHAWRSSHSACAVMISGIKNSNRDDGDNTHALE